MLKWRKKGFVYHSYQNHQFKFYYIEQLEFIKKTTCLHSLENCCKELKKFSVRFIFILLFQRKKMYVSKQLSFANFCSQSQRSFISNKIYFYLPEQIKIQSKISTNKKNIYIITNLFVYFDNNFRMWETPYNHMFLDAISLLNQITLLAIKQTRKKSSKQDEKEERKKVI